MTPLSARGTAVLRGVLIVVGVAGIAGPALVVANAPVIRPRSTSIALPPRHIAPQAVVPTVEPVDFVSLDPDDARAYNAGVPFSTDPIPPARPFRLQEDDADYARATDCLAAGVLYEAGDDAAGERAVAQVVVNRLRHPAFPKTVCGVVFEGSERSTGCQFTFSCDGALTRWHPTDAAWARARAVATAALSGSVDKPVGYATHYHTDWVVPYWQSSLDKIARVGTHLFFRWAGWWGTPSAFDRHVLGTEPVVAALADLSEAHRAGAAMAAADDATVAAAAAPPDRPLPLPTDPSTFFVRLDAKSPPDGFRAIAATACGDRPDCLVLGWVGLKTMPTMIPLDPAQRAVLSFSYLRDRPAEPDKALWNCRQFPRADRTQCMKLQPVELSDPAAPAITATPAQSGTDLGGVRRQSRGTPATPVQRGALPPTPAPLALTPLGTSPGPAPSATPRPPRSSAAARRPPA